MRPSDNSSSPEEGLGEHCSNRKVGSAPFLLGLWDGTPGKDPAPVPGSLCQGRELAGVSISLREAAGQVDSSVAFGARLA